MTPPQDRGVAEHPRRWRNLMLVSTATLLVLTVWFSTNAIAPALEDVRGYSSSDIAWLTVGVQLGFVIGTMIISLTNLADVMNTRMLFALSATFAGASNVALVFAPDSLAAALGTRILSGIFLGGVYPPGMKIISGWFRSGRGIAIGGMIAALTLGSGSPHLLWSVFVAQWELTIYISSALAVLGGAMVYIKAGDGPYDVPASSFNRAISVEHADQPSEPPGPIRLPGPYVGAVRDVGLDRHISRVGVRNSAPDR